MSRPKKDSVLLHCRLNKEVADALEAFCEESGLTKTAAVERALKMYFENYKKTGRA